MKPPRHLFDNNESVTKEGARITKKVREALAPIVERALASGVSARDLDWVIVQEVSFMIVMRHASLLATRQARAQRRKSK